MGADRILPIETGSTQERVSVDGTEFLQAVLQTTFTAGEPGMPFDTMSLSLHNGELILEASDGTSFARSSVPASVALSLPVTTVAASEMRRTAKAFLEGREQTVNLVTDSDSDLQITFDGSDTTIILGRRNTPVHIPNTDGFSRPRIQFDRAFVARELDKTRLQSVFRNTTCVIRTVQRRKLPDSIDLLLYLSDSDLYSLPGIAVVNDVAIGDLPSPIRIRSGRLADVVFITSDVTILNVGVDPENNMVIFEKPDKSYFYMTRMVKAG